MPANFKPFTLPNGVMDESLMLAKDAATTSTIRMIMAKLKDTDIAARKTPQDPGVPDDQIIAMLRGMAKSRRESVDM